jgi:hypothetical protein
MLGEGLVKVRLNAAEGDRGLGAVVLAVCESLV